MPLPPRLPGGDRVARTVGAAVFAASILGVSAQAPRELDREPARIDPWPCRVVANSTLREAFQKGWEWSGTIRRQCDDLAAARAVVVLEWGVFDSLSHAQTKMGVHGDAVVATVRIPPTGETMVLLAHELEHVLERTRGLDLRAEARRPGSGVWEASGGYETRAARDVSRRVAAELNQRSGPNRN